MLNYLYTEIQRLLDVPKQTVKLPHGVRNILKPSFKIDELRGNGVNVISSIKVQFKDSDLAIVNDNIDAILLKLSGRFFEALNTNLMFTQGMIIQGTDGYLGLLEFTLEYSPRRDLLLPESTLSSAAITFNENCEEL